MCDRPVPCKCTLERRAELRDEHIARQDALSALAHRLHKSGQLNEVESHLLFQTAEAEWDDAIHIASADDPLRSLCGRCGRNLCDLPERPDPWGGCWSCLQQADALAEDKAASREEVATPA